MKTRILFIDDEIDCLDQIKASLARKADQWTLEFSNNPEQALESIKSNPPAIVICDYHMPQMEGTELLKAVEEAESTTQRFIMADGDEKELLNEGIGSTFHFLPKPCPADTLIGEIQRTLALDTWLGNEKIKSIVAKLDEFPSLPPMYLKVINALNSSNASAENVGQAVSGDLAISAKLLQVVNSSYYGIEEKVSDIVQAVSILGLETVKNLVLAIQVFGKLGRTSDQQALADQLWHHSMSVATAAKRIAQYEKQDQHSAEEAYTAGLFHDVGKLVLINAVPEEFDKARAKAREENRPLWETENEVIGCNHAEVGAYLLGRWGLPVMIVESAALHHEPINSFGSSFSTLAAVHSANALVWERHPGEEPHPDAKIDEGFLEEIGHINSVDAWKEVVAGKLTEKPARDPQKESASGSPDEATSGNDSHKNEQAAENPTSKSNKGPSAVKVMLIGTAIAACLALTAWLFIENIPETTAKEEYADAAQVEENKEAQQTASITQPEKKSPLVENKQESEPQTKPASAKTIIEEANKVAKENSNSIDEIANTSASQKEEVSKIETTMAKPKEEIKVAAKPKDTFPTIRLTGIFYNPMNPAASVNGRIRRVGDRISGAQIIEIDSKYVTIRYRGEDRKYKLK